MTDFERGEPRSETESAVQFERRDGKRMKYRLEYYLNRKPGYRRSPRDHAGDDTMFGGLVCVLDKDPN